MLGSSSFLPAEQIVFNANLEGAVIREAPTGHVLGTLTGRIKFEDLGTGLRASVEIQNDSDPTHQWLSLSFLDLSP